jgi:hypothetical protein
MPSTCFLMRAPTPAHPAQDGFPPRKKRERAAIAVLAVMMQVAFIAIWVKGTHADASSGHSGPPGVFVMRYFPMTGTAPGTIHPNARRAKPAPAPAKQVPRVAPKSESITTEQPIVPPIIPKPEEPKSPPPDEAPPMSAREIEEFNRQWAQLQSDVKQKALDAAERHELKMDLSETNRPFQKFTDTPPAGVDRDRNTDMPRHRSEDDNSMFAGELCVSRAGPDGELSLAMPCTRDDYVTDYGWQSRVHAPDRGAPVPGTFDSSSRVIVSNYKFSAETLAAFQAAQGELYKIQVTIRMVYLPELKVPIQLMSRDNSIGAISVQAFPSEVDLAAYLVEWAGNVHRWTTHENPPSVPAVPMNEPGR